MDYRRLVNPFEPMRVFTDDQVEAIHQNALRILQEIGIRVLKEEAVIYHLGKLQAPSEDEEDPHILAIDRMALVTKQLEDLEARRQAQEAEARRRAQGTTVQNPGEVPDLGPMDLGPDLGLDPGDPDAGR